MKAVGPVIASNGVLYLQMRSAESHSTPGMEKERTDWNELNHPVVIPSDGQL